jgi:hypothetical protein
MFLERSNMAEGHHEAGSLDNASAAGGKGKGIGFIEAVEQGGPIEGVKAGQQLASESGAGGQGGLDIITGIITPFTGGIAGAEGVKAAPAPGKADH